MFYRMTRMSFSLGWPDTASQLEWDYGFLRGVPYKWSFFLSHDMGDRGKWQQHDLSLMVLLWLLDYNGMCQVLLLKSYLPFPYSTVCKGVTKSSLHSRGGKLRSSSKVASIYIYYFFHAFLIMRNKSSGIYNKSLKTDIIQILIYLKEKLC